MLASCKMLPGVRRARAEPSAAADVGLALCLEGGRGECGILQSPCTASATFSFTKERKGLGIAAKYSALQCSFRSPWLVDVLAVTLPAAPMCTQCFQNAGRGVQAVHWGARQPESAWTLPALPFSCF